MHPNQLSYNNWASQYDTNKNKTRDLEAVSLRETLMDISFNNVLEIGCGTGKNTEWLATKAAKITAVDFSEEMLAIARKKITVPKVNFIHADITNEWTFASENIDLITFCLVLEHIKDLDVVFSQAIKKLAKNGLIYIGELHPFKQYTGSLARFDTPEGRVELDCYTHHLSEFTGIAATYNLEIIAIREWFDEYDQKAPPRILTLLLKKN